MYVTGGGLLRDHRTEVDSVHMHILKRSHVEADTRMILHAKLISVPVKIYSNDTDVFVILLGHSDAVPDCSMKVGMGIEVRLLAIKSLPRVFLIRTTTFFQA